MNGKTTLDAALLMDAIGYADGGYIQELVNELGKKRGGAHVRRIRTLSTLLAAVLIMAALTATAFAAARYFGIFDFLRGRRALPGGARELIETDITPAVQADEGFPLECEAKEALADGRSLRVVAELRAREAGKYLLVPQDAAAEDSAESAGLAGNGSIADYARDNGLEILWAGAAVGNGDELGMEAQSVECRRVSDGAIDLLISGVRDEGAESFEVKLVCTAYRAGDSVAARTELSFTLENRAGAGETRYLPAGGGAIPGTKAVLTEVTVTQTDVDTYVDYHCESGYTDAREAGDAGLCFRICDPANAEEGFRSGTGSTPDENGGMLCGYVYAKTELGSGFTVEAYNCWTKEVYCRIELNAEA
ncbi:MAG: hypothetical protein Q4C32_03555 [Eubacteriales bacterium]|nr:hypothetical protein [Eubacteriales bacterium]